MLRITYDEPKSRQESADKEPQIDKRNLEKILEGPEFKIVKKETYPDVPILRFLEQDSVVLLFEGRPVRASISGSFCPYKSLYASDNGYAGTYDASCYWSVMTGGGIPEFIDAYPGCTATVIKALVKEMGQYRRVQAQREDMRQMRIPVPAEEPGIGEVWILIAKDIKYKRA